MAQSLVGVRKLNALREVLLDPKATGPEEAYFMIRGTPNITIWPPAMYGKEYNKSVGHYHKHNEPETYWVLFGEAIFVLQKRKSVILASERSERDQNLSKRDSGQAGVTGGDSGQDSGQAGTSVAGVTSTVILACPGSVQRGLRASRSDKGAGVTESQARVTQGEIAAVRLVRLKQGDNIKITGQWGHAMVNVGTTALVTRDDAPADASHAQNDYEPIRVKRGMAYYIVKGADGKPKAIPNPNYTNLPAPRWG